MYRPCESVSGNICIPYGDDNLVITYNLLNLPKEIKKSGTVVSKYAYLSDGSKVSSCDAGGNGYMYFGTARFTLDNNVPTFESIPFSGGRIVKTTNGYEPQYYLTDHLGSTRMIVNKDGKTVEATFDYTPFGVQIVNSQMPTNSTEYRFSGKELQNISDYEIYDFGARQYFPKYAIWSSADPLSETYYPITPYAYCANNPVLFVDPNGMAWYSYWDKDEDGNDVKKYYYSETRLTEQQRKAGRYTYLGLTHTDDNGNYYSLLGDIKDIKTDEGKLYSLIDQAIINFNKPQKQDPWSCEPPYEPTTDFSGIKKYKKNIFGSGNNLYMYPNSYAGTDMYFQVNEQNMSGRYVPPTEKVYGRPNYMPGGAMLPIAYYAYIRQANTSAGNIIYLPFQTKDQLISFQNKINLLFGK